MARKKRATKKTTKKTEEAAVVTADPAVETGPGAGAAPDPEWPRDEQGSVVFVVTVPVKGFDEQRHGVQFRNGVGETVIAQSALRLLESGYVVTPDPREVSAAGTRGRLGAGGGEV